MATETKLPDGLLLTNNLTGGLSAIDTDDTTWLVATSNNANSVVAVSFPTPTGDPDTGADVQGCTVKYRVTANATSITFNAYLRESGTRLNGGAVIDTWTSASTTEVTREVTWDAILLGTADGSLVELEIVAVKSGGSPTNRTTGEFQFIDWDVVYTTGSVTNFKTLVYTAIPAVALTRTVSYARTLSNTVTGTSILTRLSTFYRILSAGATGTVTFSKGLLFSISANITTIGTSVTIALGILGINSSSTATGSLTLTKLIGKVLSNAGSGVSSIIKKVSKIIVNTATGSASAQETIEAKRTASMTGTGTLVTQQAAIFKRLVTAVAIGTLVTAANFIAGGGPSLLVFIRTLGIKMGCNL